ncbi:MAG: right-handed parallel beta-helix repeat-containing protein [Proteobacteria bacterium]|nr:right-handed parallel beta-helix repeat-containing protein [Pseudomonadota bacterium]
MSTVVAAAILVVCPLETQSAGCQFHSVQEAVDRASDGDTVLLKAGRYAPNQTRDVTYKDITVRAYVAVEGKRLSIVGEKGAVLDGSTQLPSTAIVMSHANVTVRGLEITGFRYAVEEDNIYDGHGVFVIDSIARIEQVRMTHLAKMGLTGRGDSRLTVSDLQILDGHMGIWLAETAQLQLRDSTIRNNDSCALGAYDDSRARVSGSLFDGNRDDGLYTEQRAVISASHVLILNNRPIGAHAIGNSRISINHSALLGNDAAVGNQGNGVVALGAGSRIGGS